MCCDPMERIFDLISNSNPVSLCYYDISNNLRTRLFIPGKYVCRSLRILSDFLYRVGPTENGKLHISKLKWPLRAVGG